LGNPHSMFSDLVGIGRRVCMAVASRRRRDGVFWRWGWIIVGQIWAKHDTNAGSDMSTVVRFLEDPNIRKTAVSPGKNVGSDGKS
jgi:hypothetical protein